ncbi:putative LOC107374676-like protein [Nothobranchius furzeri]|uniref:Kinase n=1 Tax=Nothobranchius furzeri TaxID=105023 RepID=A0A9D3C346_NOTFU|nr:putative LOC107374676-like protein [Nothobranchius furzeri]
MEQSHTLCSTRDTEMDSADDSKHMERMEMETEDVDLCISVPARKYQHLSREGFSSCSGSRARFRPRLQATKSFPPYSQCIGGLGGDGDWKNEPMAESNVASQPKERGDLSEDVKRKPDVAAKCSRDALRTKQRFRMKDMSGSSFDGGTVESEKGRLSGKRRVEEGGEEMENNTEERKGGSNSEGKHGRVASCTLEKKEEEGGRETYSPLAVQQDNNCSMETSEGQSVETHRHPILSKLLHSSTSSSSCSSINLSSDESDEFFSEGEDAASKRKTFRKSRSWKTYLTMMHWSLRRQSSWVQLAGHQGMCDSDHYDTHHSHSLTLRATPFRARTRMFLVCNFQVSKVGEVLKMHSKPEAKCLERLMRDTLRPFVPQYHGLVTRGEHCYIRLEDLLHGLRRPVIMDCKMGVRTFQEEELIKARTKPTPRSDLYHKMVKLDSLAPTEEEHTQQGVTKWRYLQWRDVCSGHQDRRHHDGGRKRPAGFQKNPDFNSGHRSITVLHQESAGHTESIPLQTTGSERRTEGLIVFQDP